MRAHTLVLPNHARGFGSRTCEVAQQRCSIAHVRDLIRPSTSRAIRRLGLLVSARFPPRDPSRIQAEWESLKLRLNVGETVSGTIVAKAPFGAWIDIGFGFPALLLIPHVEGLTPERYRSDEWCPIGSTVTAVVGGFNDRDCQISVWQVRSNAMSAEQGLAADRPRD